MGLCLTIHAVQNVAHLGDTGMEKTGVTIGRRTIQLLSVAGGVCVFNVDGNIQRVTLKQPIKMGRTIIDTYEIRGNCARVSITAPANIMIDRWNREE